MRLTVRMIPSRRTKGSQVFTKAPTLAKESNTVRQADGWPRIPPFPTLTGLKVLEGSWNLVFSLGSQGTGSSLMPTVEAWKEGTV